MQSKDVSMLQVTCLGNCDMMKQVSAHFTSVSRITGHHVDDLRACLAEVLSPHHLQLFDNMVHRMESIAEAAASKVHVVLMLTCPTRHVHTWQSAVTPYSCHVWSFAWLQPETHALQCAIVTACVICEATANMFTRCNANGLLCRAMSGC